MREGNRVCGASFVPLGPLQLKNPPLVDSLAPTTLLLACVAGQSGARTTVYVRGIIRISYRAGRGEGEWRKRSAEVGCRGGTESEQTRERWWRAEREGGGRKIGRLPQTCLKIKVLSWPRLIFYHTPKLKM